MNCARWLAGTLALAFAAAEVHAQGIANANPAVRGSSYAWNTPRYSRVRSFGLSGYYGSPIGYGYPASFSSVAILQPYRPSTIIIVVPRDSLTRERDRDREREDQPPEGVIRFRPRRERERANEEPPPEEPISRPRSTEQPELIPPPQPLRPQPRRIEPPVEPPRAEPLKDPLAESTRHLTLGKHAFAAGEYGRAAFRFRKAAEVTPDQGPPHFLLAQAFLALGKYRDAVDAIHAGLALDPTWPSTGPSLLALYGLNNDEFALHLQQLETARFQHPGDPVLLFLQGVLLWFDGRQNDARPLFEKAAPLVPDRRDIDRFLQAK